MVRQARSGDGMGRVELDNLANHGGSSSISIYCMTSLVADQASRDGYPDLAKSIHKALEDFLTGLTREQQMDALRLSYELALRGQDPSPPALRLVYSRD